jgi:hypothetical protein
LNSKERADGARGRSNRAGFETRPGFGRTNPTATAVWQNEPDRDGRFRKTDPSAPTYSSFWQNEPERGMPFWQNEPNSIMPTDACMVAHFGRTNPSMPTSGAWQKRTRHPSNKRTFPLFFRCIFSGSE